MTTTAITDAQAFRTAMARLGAAVNLVTSDGEGGWAGFAATAVCSVTDTPPTLLVCIQRSSSAYASVLRNGVLCVNTLGPRHRHLATLFGGKTPAAQREAASAWQRLATGAPVLPQARAAFDCEIAQSIPVGSHDVLLCRVKAITTGEPNEGGLLYMDRAFRDLQVFEAALKNTDP